MVNEYPKVSDTLFGVVPVLTTFNESILTLEHSPPVPAIQILSSHL